MTFPIVAIGASAGGLEAVSELLSKKTAMPVTQIHEGLVLEPAHVYVIPPNVTLTLTENRFHLNARAREARPHHPVDSSFNSLAQVRGDTAVGALSRHAPAARDEEALRRVFRRLRSAHGVDFTHYKRSTLRRRLARRMAVRKVDELTDYVGVLEDDAAEAAALYQDFLIRVTGFFRDPESFEGLRERVFPSLCERRPSKEPIRIWVPGCASGEEVYSVAIALLEYLGEHGSDAGIQLFGTDVSETAIEKSRAARYPDTIAEEVSAERLDLLSCRNLLIYLDAAAQRRVMQVFHYSLRPTGFLMLGPSESSRAKRGPTVGRARPRTLRRPCPWTRSPPPREADRMLLARFAPASLLVEITTAIQQARESGTIVRREGLCLDQQRDISIEVIPLEHLSAQRCYLIRFDDGSRPPVRCRSRKRTSAWCSWSARTVLCAPTCRSRLWRAAS